MVNRPYVTNSELFYNSINLIKTKCIYIIYLKKKKLIKYFVLCTFCEWIKFLNTFFCEINFLSVITFFLVKSFLNFLIF